ncbi:MAG: hypothetical protein R3181_06745 [Rubricoccaceae bacterium]|nr:hypothetical protein [Rubricoccaceae bacterium]
MEPERPTPLTPDAAPRTELRALAQLRDRVEAAAQEMERLRAENTALAARVAEVQDGDAPGAAAPALLAGEDPEKLRAQIRGFIEAIDQVLNAPEASDVSRSRNG